jgi:hypothetical protein
MRDARELDKVGYHAAVQRCLVADVIVIPNVVTLV